MKSLIRRMCSPAPAPPRSGESLDFRTRGNDAISNGPADFVIPASAGTRRREYRRRRTSSRWLRAVAVRRVVAGAGLAIACGLGTPAWAETAGVKPQGQPHGEPDCPPSSSTACPCPASAFDADADAGSGRFGVDLLAAVSGEGRANALVSPLGIGAVLAMLSQGAVEPVRRSIREMLGGGGEGGADGEVAGGTEPLQSAGTTSADDSNDINDSVGVTVDAADAEGAGEGIRDVQGETAQADGSAPADTLSCRLATVLAAAGEDPGVKLNIANAAFADRRLDLFPSFSAVLEDRFDAQVERLDFADAGTVPRINAWVARETDGAIPSLVSRLEPDAALVLANAMHFHGEWTRPFDPALTVPLPFHPHAVAAIEVATMRAEGLSARYREDADFQAVTLPYGGTPSSRSWWCCRAQGWSPPARCRHLHPTRRGWLARVFTGRAATCRFRGSR